MDELTRNSIFHAQSAMSVEGWAGLIEALERTSHAHGIKEAENPRRANQCEGPALRHLVSYVG